MASIDWSYVVVQERGDEVTAGRWTSLRSVQKMTGPLIVTSYSTETAVLCALEQIAPRKTFQRLVAGFLGRSRTALCPTEIAGPLVVTRLTAETTDLCALEQIASDKDEIQVVCRVHRASPPIVGTGNGPVAGRTHHDSVMCETLWL